MRCCTEHAVVSSLPAAAGAGSRGGGGASARRPRSRRRRSCGSATSRDPSTRGPRASAVPCPGAAQTAAMGRGTCVSCEKALKKGPPIQSLYRWDLRGGARRARGPGAPGGAGGGAGSDPRLPLRETRARPRAPERRVCEGVGCGAGCGTRCGPPTPARPREGTRRSLVAAPAVAQYPGGGRHKLLLAAHERPAPREGSGRRRGAPLQRPNPTHC